MTPKITYWNTPIGYTVMIDDVQVGAAIDATEAAIVRCWLRQSWPDLTVAVLACAGATEKKRKVRK